MVILIGNWKKANNDEPNIVGKFTKLSEIGTFVECYTKEVLYKKE